MGIIAPVFDVSEGGRTHHALRSARTAFDFGNDVPRLGSNVDTTRTLAGVVKAQKIGVLVSNHSTHVGSITKAGCSAHPDGTQAFVPGTSPVELALTTMGECVQAQRDGFPLC